MRGAGQILEGGGACAGRGGGGGAGGARTEHLAQKTLLVCIRGTSLCPTGSTGCPWQKARGQRPKCVFLYLSSIALRPRGVMMKRAWMRPYSSSAADSIDSCAAVCVLACARGRGVRVAGAGAHAGVAAAHSQRRDACCSLLRAARAHLLLLGEARRRRALHIEDGVQRELIVRHLCAQSGQVEVVLDEVLLDFRKELVALERAEP